MPNMLKLDRQILARFLPNHQSILAFEQMQNNVSEALPSTIEEAASLAALATTIAQQALGMIGDVMVELERLVAAPRAELGTISSQNADAVDITGGRIGLDAGTVAAPSFYLGGDDATGFYRISANRWGYAFNGVKLLDLADKLAILTGRLVVDSASIGTAALPSLYLATDNTTGFYRIGADNWGFTVAGTKLLDYSSALVSVTGSLTATSQLRSTVATGTAPLVVASTTKVANLNADLLDGGDWASPGAIGTTARSSGAFTSLSSSGAFGCNGAAPQTPAALTLPATDLPTVIALANSLRDALTANGIGV